MSKEKTEKAIRKMIDKMPKYHYTVKFEAVEKDTYEINRITSTIEAYRQLTTKDIQRTLEEQFYNVKINSIKKYEV